jgi:ribosomal protein S27AE
MNILVIIIFIGIISWAIVDYKKINKEERRCPKCKQIVEQKFSWNHNDRPVSITGKNGEKLNVTIYKCQNCGFGWNHTYEYSENTT